MFRLILGAAAMLAPSRAFAHHAMDGRMPETFMEGLLSGLAHPVIGPDHLAFVVAVGLIAAGLANGRLLPLAFLAAMVGGVGVHLAALDLPFAELAIAGSVLLLGLLLALQARLSVVGAAALFAAAGLFHGYAYGEAIVGSEAAPLLAYLAGLVAVQYALALGVMEVARRLPAMGRGGAPAMRAAGVAVGVVGAVFLTLNVIG